MKTTEYEVIECRLLTRLVQTVNTFITAGWKPIGGVSSVADDKFVSHSYYLQAMVREQEGKR